MTNVSQTDAEETDKDGAAEGLAPAERIRALNDELRKTGTGGKTYISRGILSKDADFIAKVTAAVRSFDAFSDDNDPWQEHDCAIFDVDGESVMFKIDYYDLDLQDGSPDPADPAVTRRVLTIMLAEEY